MPTLTKPLALSALLAVLAMQAMAADGVQVVAGVDEPVPVPSGQSVTLPEIRRAQSSSRFSVWGCWLG